MKAKRSGSDWGIVIADNVSLRFAIDLNRESAYA
jgi:hypothetical protein